MAFPMGTRRRGTRAAPAFKGRGGTSTVCSSTSATAKRRSSAKAVKAAIGLASGLGATKGCTT